MKLLEMGALAFCFVVPACSSPTKALAVNRVRYQQVEAGMSRAQVEEVMGAGLVYSHRSYQITNPWRSDSFLNSKGDRIDVLYYYVEERNRNWYDASREELAPVVLVNGSVTGRGWDYLEARATDLEVVLK